MQKGISSLVLVSAWGASSACWFTAIGDRRLLGFPTSAGDEWELEGQGMVGAVLADFIDAGRIKFFAVNSINGSSFYNKSAHPFHRSYVQSLFDSYLREEVVPFIWDNCQSPASPFPPWAHPSARIMPPTRFSNIPT